jgi:hypothetical protein
VLRISIEENSSPLLVRLEGRLVGPWVSELQRLCDEQNAGRSSVVMTIDLCGVTGMDAKGRLVLDDLLHRGATLLCSDVMNRYLVDQMTQPGGRFEDACRPCNDFR